MSEPSAQDAMSYVGASPFACSKLLLQVSSLAVLGLAVHLIHNRYLHPLSNFPGPAWGGLTDFYHLYLFATKRYHERCLKLHEQYGPLVRIGPNQLMFDDPALLPLVYHREAEKTPFYSTGLAGEVAPLLQIQGHDAHSAKLRTLSPSYGMKNLRLLEPSIDSRIEETVNAMRKRFVHTEQQFDLASWVRFYVYDTITTLLYGKPVGMIEQGRDVQDLIVSWHDMFTLGGLVATLPWLVHALIVSWPFKTFWMPRKGHRKGSGHIMNVHERLFRERLQDPSRAVPGNLFDSFCNVKRVDGTAATLEDAERECYLLTVASQDTTAGFITPLLQHIAADVNVYGRVMDEIRDREMRSLLSNPVVSYDETCGMPYFMACCKETLRLQPPTPIILPRFVARPGLFYQGAFIPPGTEIGANPHVVHRNKTIFGADTETFRPERWLSDPKAAKRMDKSMLSWGHGSRKCIGKNIALIDSQKLVVQLLREFEMAPVNRDKPWQTENWGINVFWDHFVTLKERSK